MKYEYAKVAIKRKLWSSEEKEILRIAVHKYVTFSIKLLKQCFDKEYIESMIASNVNDFF